MRVVYRDLFVCLSLAALCLGIAMPAMAQKVEVTKYSDVAPGTPLGPAVPSGPPDAPNGTLTFFTDRASFQAAAGSTTLEDFSLTNVPPGAITACPPPFNSTTNNACFSPGDIVDGISMDVIIAGGGGQGVVIGVGALGNPDPWVGPNSFIDNSRWDMTLAIGAWGADFFCPISAATMNIEVFDTGGASLGTSSTPCGAGGNFWGVISTVDIGNITVTDPTGTGELYANVEFGAGGVPTMPDWAMIALLVVLLAIPAVLLRRRQSA